MTIVSAIGAVSLANPVYCAMWFGMTLLGTAGLFFFQGAQFLALATVIVYAGAILVTFLFVLMLAQPDGRAYYDRTSWEALLVGGGRHDHGRHADDGDLHALAAARRLPPLPAGRHAAAIATRRAWTPDHVARLGGELFGRHLLAVELAGMLLTAALVGAAAIAGHGRSASRRGDAKREAAKSRPQTATRLTTEP